MAHLKKEDLEKDNSEKEQSDNNTSGNLKKDKTEIQK